MQTINNQQSNQPTVAELLAQLQAMKAENERLKTTGRVTSNGLKVSEKGAISIYGLQRFPVTLYADTWKKLLGMREEILSFIEAETAKGTLAIKPVANPSDKVKQ